DGSVVAQKRGNARGAKGPGAQRLRQHGRQGRDDNGAHQSARPAAEALRQGEGREGLAGLGAVRARRQTGKYAHGLFVGQGRLLPAVAHRARERDLLRTGRGRQELVCPGPRPQRLSRLRRAPDLEGADSLTPPAEPLLRAWGSAIRFIFSAKSTILTGLPRMT